MLELRQNCELCDRDLPPHSTEARICTYECTYCADCVESRLHDVCPTCGGNFCPRPIRPKRAYRDIPKLGLHHQPASKERKYSKFSAEEIDRFCSLLKDVAATER